MLFLNLLAGVYGLLQGLHTTFRSYRPVWKPRQAKVLSVGNLAVGGTGKTVLVDYLLQFLSGKAVLGVASRGYRSDSDGWNDEMKLLKEKHPDCLFASHSQRWRAIKELEDKGCTLILLDDGFQHRAVHRDLDLVILDATDPFAGGLLPQGRLREQPSALERADVILLSHADALTVHDREILVETLSSRFGKPVLPACHRMRPPCRDTEILKPGPVHLLAGVGQPSHVVRGLEEMGYVVTGTTLPGDHRRPSAEELETLNKQEHPIVCTLKDWVKRQGDWPWYVTEVQWQWINHDQILQRQIEQRLNL